MKRLLIIFFACVVLDGIIASPITKSHKLSGNKYEAANNFRVNLNYLGDRIYGLPSREAGRRVHNWRKGDKVNPEELGGYAEGDILFSAAPKNGWASKSSRWPGKTVPYVITGSSFSAADHAMIQSAIDDFHQHTCIRFVPRTNERVYIRITSKSSGCYSSVGYTGYSYDVNLQTPGCTSEKGTVLHELTHAVGFVHEQSRAERDEYISINWNNIKEDEVYNFEKYPRRYMNYFGVPYDYTSVMHYSRYAFTRNGGDTIVPKLNNDIELGRRDGFSKSDILRINRMYQCSEARTDNQNFVHPEKSASGTKLTYTTSLEFSTEKPRIYSRIYCIGAWCWKVYS